jgi:hypothetical protein
MPNAIIESECIIDAPIDDVWKVLIDLEKYGDWNPFVQTIEANLQQMGSPVILHVDMHLKSSNNSETKKLLVAKQEMMTCNIEDHLLQWKGGVLGGYLLRNVRTQRLTTITGSNQTKYYTSDEFWGPLVSMVRYMHGDNIQVGFDANAAALKERCEEK